MSTVIFWRAFWRSCIAAAGTAAGGLLLLCSPSPPSERFVGWANGMSAGIMLYLSFFDILPEAIFSLGLPGASASFFGGALLLVIVSNVVHHDSFRRHFDALSTSLPELMPSSPSSRDRKVRHSDLVLSAVLTAIVLAIHNAPEGLAVLFSSQDAHSNGLALALGISFHNVGEGAAVAASTYAATQSMRKSIMLAAVSGLAEPISVVFGHLILHNFITPTFIRVALAGCAGTMATLCLFELIPLAIAGCARHGQEDEWKMAVGIGMFISSIPLCLLSHF